MKIRKAKKGDLNEYVRLKKISTIEYIKLIRKKINITEKQMIKEFNEFFHSPRRFLLVVEHQKNLIGYLIGTEYISIYKKTGFIDDIFILKEHRGNKIGTSLIKTFFLLLKKKNIKYSRLGVNPKNKIALNLYKKLGFKITHYEMEKKI